MKKLVMVEEISSFRIRYVVEVEDDIEHALDEVICRAGEIHEFSQKHLEPTSFIDHYEITKEQYLEMFDRDNDYLKDWSEEQKLKWINKINYEENT